jgi:integrase
MRNTTLGSLSLFTPAGHRKYLTSDERQRFLEAAARHVSPRVRTLCAVLTHTGCRVSEALALTPGSIDAAEGFIAVRCLKKRSKTPVVREVPVPSELIELVRAIHGTDGVSVGKLWSWSRSRAWQIVKQVMNDAGIPLGPHATPKGLRHGFGLHAIRCGVPINLVQRWLGHASMSKRCTDPTFPGRS